MYSSTANSVIPNKVTTISWTGLTFPRRAPYAMREPAQQKSALIRLWGKGEEWGRCEWGENVNKQPAMNDAATGWEKSLDYQLGKVGQCMSVLVMNSVYWGWPQGPHERRSSITTLQSDSNRAAIGNYLATHVAWSAPQLDLHRILQARKFCTICVSIWVWSYSEGTVWICSPKM